MLNVTMQNISNISYIVLLNKFGAVIVVIV